MATEVVLFEKLGENEVVEAIDFGINQQKKLRRSEHPTLRDAGERRRDAVSTERHIPTGCGRAASRCVSTERRIPTGCKERKFRCFSLTNPVGIVSR
jgi:hypothetical protein